MSTGSYTLNPSCSPDTCLLWVGPNRIGYASLDATGRSIRTIGYHAFDPYDPDPLREPLLEAFGEGSVIRRVIVALRFDQWVWTPSTSGNSSDALDAWIRPFFPERIGHRWITDTSGPDSSIAWVETPVHLLTKLQSICSHVECRHAVGFVRSNNNDTATQLELTRVGNRCWISLHGTDHFQYGQPHLVEQPDDLLYVLGILFEKYNVQASGVKLSLVGEWEPGDEWLHLLRSRFPHIEGRDNVLSGLLTDVPGHWFTPIADLLVCV